MSDVNTPTGAPARYIQSPQLRYVEFSAVPVGATFGDSQQWIKQSTRTARHATVTHRVFYFRQSDIVQFRKDAP